MAVALLPIIMRAPGPSGAANGWTSVASLNQSRSGHTATTLDNGRVLVVGGFGPAIPPAVTVTLRATPEVYDPVANTWTVLPAMTHPRLSHTAVKLNDGRVFVVGGYAAGSNVRSAELYNPVAGAWAGAGEPANLDWTIDRGVLLTDGDVFVVGQRLLPPQFPGGGQQIVGGSAIYDPDTNTWTAGPDVPVSSAVLATLSAGSVLLTGWGAENAALYVPPGSVDATPEMPAMRDGHTMTGLPDGRVLVTGNDQPSYLYVPATQAFTAAPAIPDARTMYTATQLYNGLVLVTGGHGPSVGGQPWTVYASGAVFDWNAGTWSPIGSMSITRYRHAAAALFDGRILISGGNESDSAISAAAEVFDPAAAPTPVPTSTPASGGTQPPATYTHTPTPAIIEATATFTATPGGPTSTFTPTPDPNVTPPPTPTFTPTPDPNVTPPPTPTFSPTGTPSSLPDLVITSIRIELQTGGSCAFTTTALGTTVVVRNNGSAAAGPFTVSINGTLVNVPGLLGGVSTTLWISGYQMTANVTVDSTNAVAESNESNNTASQLVPIPTLPPTCTPTATSTSTPTPTATPTATPAPCLIDPGGVNSDAYVWQQPGKSYNDVTRASSDSNPDACDDDDDNDGLGDSFEITGPPCLNATGPTDPLKSDTDGDRFLDGAECFIPGGNPNDAAVFPSQAGCGDAVDADGDGVLMYRERCYYSTSDSDTDTDGDGCSDGREVASINGDQTVNAIDLSQVAQAFGTYSSVPGPWPAHLVNFDINKDGAIGAIDLSLIAQRFGAC